VYAQQDQTASDGNAANSSAVAAVPRLIKYSGVVRDARGEPLGSVAVRLTFAVYSEQQGGAALWAESQVAQLDEQGYYAVLLGATRADGLPVELFPSGKARWLGVQVEGRDEDSRVLLVSVPYALKAEDAAMLGGRQASDFVLGEQLKEEVKAQVEAQKPGIATQAVEMLVSNPPKVPAVAEGPSTFTCATTGDCVAVTQSGTGRALRTTATSANEAVLVQQTGTGYGLRALSPGNVALYGQITSSAGTSYGVKGQTTSTTGAGVFGYNVATTGLAYGILGQTSSTSGTALFGRATATTGATIGLRGHADSTSGTGIVGQATAASGTTTGIVGRVFSAAGTALIVDNTKGGKLLSGQVNGVEKLSVDGSGNVLASGSVTASSSSVAVSGSNTANSSAGSLGTTSVEGVLTGGTTGHPTGVYGISDTFGVHGAGLWGIYGEGTQYGVYAKANYGGVYGSGTEYGVYGGGGTYGVRGSGSTYGVDGSGPTGVFGYGGTDGGNGTGVYGFGGTIIPDGGNGTGVYGLGGTAINGTGGVSIGVYGEGSAGFATSTGVYGVGATYGVKGESNGDGATGVLGINTNSGGNLNWGVKGIAYATDANAVEGEALSTTGPAYGVLGTSQADRGIGVAAYANSQTGQTTGVLARVSSASGVAGKFHVNNDTTGTLLLGVVGNVGPPTPVFRVDSTGKGFFNGGTQTGGADFAESFAVAGERARYGPGDVLVIDPLANRRVALSSQPYSTAVAGIYSTKPGVLATPYEMDDGRLTKEIPLAIVGIVPCKVTAENGAIERGDLLVASSTPGHAMKGTDRARLLGAVVGKALEPLREGTGVIEVLVTLQ
jgi:hypothetical protein